MSRGQALIEVRTLVVGQLAANCYLVIDNETRDAVVIDPGDDAPGIVQAVRDADARLTNILLTHGHPDHSFAAGELQQSFYEAKVLMHEADIPQLQGEMDIVSLFYDPDCYVTPLLGKALHDLDMVRIGSVWLQVLHTPGHTPGGLCYLTDGIVFTGDTLFAGGIGRTDLTGGSYEELMDSIRTRLLHLPDDTIIYPGHGSTSTIGHQRRTNHWLS